MQIAYLTVARSDCFQNGNSRVDKAKEVLGIELENPEFEYVPKRNKFDRVKSFWLRIQFKRPGQLPDHRPLNARSRPRHRPHSLRPGKEIRGTRPCTK